MHFQIKALHVNVFHLFISGSPFIKCKVYLKSNNACRSTGGRGNKLVKAVSRATVNGQDVETTTTYSNFQKTDYGYVIPFTQELVLPQGISMTVNGKKVGINKTIDPAIFEMPKQ